MGAVERRTQRKEDTVALKPLLQPQPWSYTHQESQLGIGMRVKSAVDRYMPCQRRARHVEKYIAHDSQFDTYFEQTD
jgi:hypothetical protein